MRVLIQGVAGDVDAGHFLFHRQQRAFGVFLYIRIGDGAQLKAVLKSSVKEGQLVFVVVAFLPCLLLHHGFVHLHALHPATAQAVKRAGFNQGFHRALVDGAAVHPLAKIKDVAEIPAFLPFGHNRQRGLLAQAFDGVEAKADALFAFVCIHNKLDMGVVNQGRQDGDLIAPAKLHIDSDLARVAQVGVDERRHELGRVMALEPSRFDT